MRPRASGGLGSSSSCAAKCWRSQSSPNDISVTSDGGGCPVAVEDVGSVSYLSNQSDVYIHDIVSQFMNPRFFGVVSSAPVDDAPVSSNHPRAALVPTPLSPNPYASGEIDSCDLGVFRSHCLLLLLLRLIFNKHSQI